MQPDEGASRRPAESSHANIPFAGVDRNRIPGYAVPALLLGLPLTDLVVVCAVDGSGARAKYAGTLPSLASSSSPSSWSASAWDCVT